MILLSSLAMEEVYEPREDSYLLQECIPQNLKGKKILDMGTGSGILAITAAKNGGDVTAVDISPEALKAAEKNAKRQNVKIKFILSDLFENIAEKYDLIIFNPPYVPENEFDEKVGTSRIYSGGKSGREVLERFIKDVKRFLSENGEILIVISSLTGEKETFELFRKASFEARIVVREKVPWEELLVLYVQHRAALYP